MSERENAEQVAKRYGVTKETVLAWARRGWIPCLRVGQRAVFFDPVAVDRAMVERGSTASVRTGGGQ